jgi:hypothetical protein
MLSQQSLMSQTNLMPTHHLTINNTPNRSSAIKISEF